jgi:hypothetical protein
MYSYLFCTGILGRFLEQHDQKIAQTSFRWYGIAVGGSAIKKARCLAGVGQKN